MIRTEWSEKLEFASQATLSQLIDPQARVTDEALSRTGLPKIDGCLYPAVTSASVQRDTYDPGLQILSGRPDPEGPQHLFVADTGTGRVEKVSRAVGEYRVPVNTSIRHFAEMAWRYYHIKPVLFEMQHSGTDEVPFADADEEAAVAPPVRDGAAASLTSRSSSGPGRG